MPADAPTSPLDLRLKYLLALRELQTCQEALDATPEADAVAAAECALEEIVETFPVDTDFCIGCEKPVFAGEPRLQTVEGDSQCADCAPTWEEFRRTPEMFWTSECVPYTPEAAEARIADHLAAGGAITDSMVATPPARPAGGSPFEWINTGPVQLAED